MRLVSIVALVTALIAFPANAAAPADCAFKPVEGRDFLQPTNVLEEKILAFACKPSDATMTDLANTLMASKLYVKVKEDGDPQTGRVAVWVVPLADGSKALAVYSSKDALARSFTSNEEHRYNAYTAKGILEMTGDSSLALNWGYDPHVVFPPATVQKMRSILEAEGAGKPTP